MVCYGCFNIFFGINKLDNIQRRSARFVKGDYRTTSSVTQMLQELGWQDLQSRRRDLRLALLYKVVMGHVGIQPEHADLVAADDRTRAKHQFKFCAVGSSTQALRHSFAVRNVGDWNSLTYHVIKKVKERIVLCEIHHRTTGRHLSMGSHSVICHPIEVTVPPSPQPGRLVLDLSIP